jgi:GTP-binding protein
MARGRRIKLRSAHQGGKNPPIIVIHGNLTDAVPPTYQRYLMNRFRECFDLHGTPLRIEFKGGENPFEGRKNTLTKRQVDKRRRMMKHVKKR